MKTLIITGADMSRHAEIIRAGGLVAVPTETVYGLAGNGLSEASVSEIYRVKGRPAKKPISLLVSGLEQAELFCKEIPETARILAQKFWPGPLTMVLHRNEKVPDIVVSGGTTVGVRCPDHALTLEIIRLSGTPLAAPSANFSGEESPKSAEAVLSYFEGKIDCIVDGGTCSVGTESTILDLTVDPPKILRHGGLSAKAIESFIKTGV